MHHTLRSARPAAVLALALVAALVAPGTAFAGTTAPTPVTTTPGSSTSTTSTASSGTSTGTESNTSSTTGTDTTTGTTTPSGTTTTTPSTTTLPTETSATTGKTTTATPAEPTSPPAGLVLGGASRYGLKAAAAGPATSTDPTLVAAHYLATELQESEGAFFTIFDGVKYFDWGLTADAVIGLDAAGAGQDQAAATTSLLAANVKSYTTGVDWGAPDDVSAGSTAKLLNVAVAQNVDPGAFGGVDLVATLEGLLGPDGLFVDRGASNFTNTIGQSLGIIGLDRVNPSSASLAPSAAVAGLRSLQCSDGGFRLFYPAADDTGCSSDPDATAYAIQALVAVTGAGDADVQRALDYLATKQNATTGGVGGSGPTAAANANSTGLAGQAFLAGGRTAPARLAARFIASLQYGCEFPTALRGGIAYDQSAYTAQSDAGADAEPADQDRRSTAQAILALAGTPLSVVSSTGADATTPALACAAATTSTTTSSTTSSSTTGSSTGGASTTSAPADPAAAPAASATPGNLAFTGSNVAAMVLLAVLLLGAGAVALVVARRKGAHT
jgi:hypothetical protein